jgi:alpha-tubulin suppressor-like RCC1 family protein
MSLFSIYSNILAKLAFMMNVNNSGWVKLKTLSLFSVKRLLSQSYKAVTMCLVFSLFIVLAGCGNDGGGSYADDKVKLKTITAMSSSHSFAFSNNGSVYASGFNNIGQLGLGDNVSRNTFTEVTGLRDKDIISIAAGLAHSLALSNDGKVYATGWNERGQLGLGNNVSRNTFTEVDSLRDKDIISIRPGRYHSFVFGKDGRVYATGWNERGQLGLGNNVNRNTFTEVTYLSNKNITSIFTGEAFALALSDNGRVYVTGRNIDGQLGLGDNNDRNAFMEVNSLSDKNITQIATGRWHSFIWGKDGRVYAAGWNERGQLGLSDNVSRNTFTEVDSLRDKNIISIVGGGQHSLALGKDGRVYAAGLNNNGQLGLGNNNDSNTFMEVNSLRDKNITSIVAGDIHSLAFSNDGKVYATGRNIEGQLGLGDNVTRNVFTKVTIP